DFPASRRPDLLCMGLFSRFCIRALQPLDRDYLAAGRLDPRHRIFRVLDHGRHVMCIGVHDGLGVANDGDMAFPEDQVATPEMLRFRDAERAAEPVALHVAVARAAGAGRRQRYLYQARAVDAEGALAAPEIGCADEAFGHRDEIGRLGIEGAEMLPWHV